MPADASIYSQIRPWNPGPGPLEQYGQAMTLKNLVTQSQLQDRALAEDEATREAYRMSGGDPTKLRDLLYGKGLYKPAMAVEKAGLEMAQTRGAIEKSKLESFGLAAKQLRDMTATVTDDSGMAMLRENAVRLFGPDMAAKMNIPQTFDPAWKQKQILTADKLLEQIENQRNRDVTMRGQNQPVWDSDRGVFVPKPGAGMGGGPGPRPDKPVWDAERGVFVNPPPRVPGVMGGAPIGGVITVPGITPIPKLTPGQEAADKEFAKEFATFKTGGAADSAKQMAQLKDVIFALENENVTGTYQGLANTLGISGVASPRSTAVRERIEEVVQRSLRSILGAQFTEKEGERLIARAYNPYLDEKENLVRVSRLMKQLEQGFKSKAEATEYFEKNGTLSGWRGKLPTIEDFEFNDSTLQKTDNKQSAFDSLPDPAKFKGKQMTDTATGMKYRSDGTKWLRQ